MWQVDAVRALKELEALEEQVTLAEQDTSEELEAPEKQEHPMPSRRQKGCGGALGAKRLPRTSYPASQPRTGDNSETRRGNRIGFAHPPSLHKHSLVTIRKLDVDGLRIDGRDGIGDVIDHLDENTVVVADQVGLKPRNHVLPYLIVFVKNLCHDGIIGSGGNHKLKKGVARIFDVVRFESSLGELVRRADVFAVPAVKAGQTIKALIFGWRARQSDLIGCDGLLPE